MAARFEIWDPPSLPPPRCVCPGCDAQCYLHSYNGFPTNTTTIYGGIKAAVGSAAAVTYSLGSNQTCQGGGASSSKPASRSLRRALLTPQVDPGVTL